MTTQLGLIGQGLHRSLSPVIYDFLARKQNLELQYLRFELEPRDLKHFFQAQRNYLKLRGFNITLPHKVASLDLLDRISDEARNTGAVNTVSRRGDRLEGFNTDVFGIQKALGNRLSTLSSKSKCLLFGAGGAARAMGTVLGKSRINHTFIVNRSPARARSLCKKLKTDFPSKGWSVLAPNDLPELDPAPIELLCNATPCKKKNEVFPFQIPHISGSPVCFDMVYPFVQTPFLRKVGSRGIRIHGIDMLIWQAIGAWKVWFAEDVSRHFQPLREFLFKKAIQ